MSEIKHRITFCSKEVARKSNYNQNKLEELINSIISKTSGSEAKFRIEVESYTESDKESKAVKIIVGRDMASSSITLQIQLIGYSEIWMIHIYLKKDMQKKASIFFNEMKRFSQYICTEENKAHLSLNPESQNSEAVSESKVESLGRAVSKAAIEVQPKKRRKKIITSSVVTDDVILSILKSWDRDHAGIKKIYLREFRDILSALAIFINVLMVVRFLENKGIVKTIPIERKPMIEMTEVGIDILNEHKEQLAAEKLEAEKTRYLQSALKFPAQSLSQLRALQNILDLQAKISGYEKELIRINGEKDKCFQELRKIILSINPDSLSKLVETAENSTHKN